ncbi:ABC transporter permease [Yimella sp. cx-51]|uniref:ABC transporter permease n=1 Tax=Yimella sp. cx-51 TaxID=2770551 RepID=UPI00165E6380|nr:ABC transporter permease [Yimella sp. cx-51]MBC9955900.1 ABC transporter permease [Yimella sp. cx-51]QTH37557.1 hypothetical protein J5M86_11840 [Yimella sp. cx-51]
MSQSPVEQRPRRGVIHDIGYRPFTGRRGSTGAIAWSLYLTSLKNVFGIGRTGKAKVVPILVFTVLMVPALVLAGIIVQLDRMSLSEQADLFGPLSSYYGFPYWMQLPITVFVATQAPVLFARDLRYRSIVLYFARPLSRGMYVLMRLAALATAIYVLILTPLAIWYGVALTSSLDSGQHTKNFFTAVAGVFLLSLILTTVSCLISALTTRAGLAVAAVIVVLMISSGVVTAVLGVAYAGGNREVTLVAAAFSPFTAVAELVGGISGQPMPIEPLVRPGTAGTIAYAGICLAWIIVPALALVARLRKAVQL